ncbi:hypothetical protein C8R45DRAFT_1224404 [Mycena sanguinolenta]|nr:hypothetical protein C8R45DRAFT_1224404 [Mycena sanguinolenta]
MAPLPQELADTLVPDEKSLLTCASTATSQRRIFRSTIDGHTVLLSVSFLTHSPHLGNYFKFLSLLLDCNGWRSKATTSVAKLSFINSSLIALLFLTTLRCVAFTNESVYSSIAALMLETFEEVYLSEIHIALDDEDTSPPSTSHSLWHLNLSDHAS